MIHAFAEGVAATAQPSGVAGFMASGGMSSILMMVALLAVFYFILIRPQKKQEKETKAMLNALKVGDQIITIGGIAGKVVKIKDDKVVVETGSPADKHTIEMRRWAIREVAKEAKENKSTRELSEANENETETKEVNKETK